MTFEGRLMSTRRMIDEFADKLSLAPIPKLEPIATRTVGMNPRAWGFETAEEMEAAFAAMEENQ